MRRVSLYKKAKEQLGERELDLMALLEHVSFSRVVAESQCNLDQLRMH